MDKRLLHALTRTTKTLFHWSWMVTARTVSILKQTPSIMKTSAHYFLHKVLTGFNFVVNILLFPFRFVFRHLVRAHERGLFVWIRFLLATKQRIDSILVWRLVYYGRWVPITILPILCVALGGWDGALFSLLAGGIILLYFHTTSAQKWLIHVNHNSGQCPSWKTDVATEFLTQHSDPYAARGCRSTQMIVWRYVGAILRDPNAITMMDHPGPFDDPNTWRAHRRAFVFECAQRGWINPDSTFAYILGEDQKQFLSSSLGTPFDSPWPGDILFCETLCQATRRLLNSDLGQQLCGMSQSALEHQVIAAAAPALLAPTEKKTLRL